MGGSLSSLVRVQASAHLSSRACGSHRCREGPGPPSSRLLAPAGPAPLTAALSGDQPGPLPGTLRLQLHSGLKHGLSMALPDKVTQCDV